MFRKSGAFFTRLKLGINYPAACGGVVYYAFADLSIEQRLSIESSAFMFSSWAKDCVSKAVQIA